MPADPPEVSIIVPLKDEERNVVPLHDELTRVLDAARIAYEIILVDDGSDDATFAQAAAVHARDPRVRVIRFTRNFGQTAAFAAGFAAARGRFIITFDGDLQNDPEDIPKLLAVAETHDIVCGWRQRRQDSFLTRALPSITANYLLGLVTGIRLHDNGCSLKVFRAEVVKPLRLRPGMHRYLPALAQPARWPCRRGRREPSSPPVRAFQVRPVTDVPRRGRSGAAAGADGAGGCRRAAASHRSTRSRRFSSSLLARLETSGARSVT